MSIAVVSVCDTPETLLTSRVPNLKRKKEEEEIFIIIFTQTWPIINHNPFIA